MAMPLGEGGCWAVLRSGYCLTAGVRSLGIPWNPSISPQAACEWVNVCVYQYLGVRCVHGCVCVHIHMDTWESAADVRTAQAC